MTKTRFAAWVFITVVHYDHGARKARERRCLTVGFLCLCRWRWGCCGRGCRGMPTRCRSVKYDASKTWKGTKSSTTGQSLPFLGMRCLIPSLIKRPAPAVAHARWRAHPQAPNQGPNQRPRDDCKAQRHNQADCPMKRPPWGKNGPPTVGRGCLGPHARWWGWWCPRRSATPHSSRRCAPTAIPPMTSHWLGSLPIGCGQSLPPEAAEIGASRYGIQRCWKGNLFKKHE